MLCKKAKIRLISTLIPSNLTNLISLKSCHQLTREVITILFQIILILISSSDFFFA